MSLAVVIMDMMNLNGLINSTFNLKDVAKSAIIFEYSVAPGHFSKGRKAYCDSECKSTLHPQKTDRMFWPEGSKNNKNIAAAIFALYTIISQNLQTALSYCASGRQEYHTEFKIQ